MRPDVEGMPNFRENMNYREVCRELERVGFERVPGSRCGHPKYRRGGCTVPVSKSRREGWGRVPIGTLCSIRRVIEGYEEGRRE